MTLAPDQLRILAIIIALTVVSGIADSQGYVHSAKVWQAGRIVWKEVAISAAAFAFGITIYWLTVRFYQQLGISFAETQIIFWFTVTIIGVAVVSGRLAQWQRLDQIVAVGVLCGVGWLLFRTGN